MVDVPLEIGAVTQVDGSRQRQFPLCVLVGAGGVHGRAGHHDDAYDQLLMPVVLGTDTGAYLVTGSGTDRGHRGGRQLAAVRGVLPHPLDAWLA